MPNIASAMHPIAATFPGLNFPIAIVPFVGAKSRPSCTFLCMLYLSLIIEAGIAMLQYQCLE
ncbi:hypothetical protein [Paramesorhizobium deserti]|uniref:hypothetical protein n=1 Tax=Paramesorhizobium deserti TaxID=1494590 RepID=UPI001910003E|nr:hypothetical protein [Paramesorhizobium deserti]